MTTEFRWFAHYEPDVAHSVDVPDGTVHQMLLDSAARFPDQTALRMVLRYLPLGLRVQARLSYAELNRLSDRFAAALVNLGVAKGDRVSPGEVGDNPGPRVNRASNCLLRATGRTREASSCRSDR